MLAVAINGSKQFSKQAILHFPTITNSAESLSITNLLESLMTAIITCEAISTIVKSQGTGTGGAIVGLFKCLDGQEQKTPTPRLLSSLPDQKETSMQDAAVFHPMDATILPLPNFNSCLCEMESGFFNGSSVLFL